MALELHNTENPLSNAERLKINENWQRIISGHSHLQQQIKVLAGGAEVDELIQRLNDAIDNANVAVQKAIDANKTATQEAIEANDTALQTALDKVSKSLVDMNDAIVNAKTATSEANAAKQSALDATTQAQDSINKMKAMIDNLRPRGVWDVETQYYTNNIVTFENNSYIALQNNIGRTPPLPPLKANIYWSLLAGQGAKGDRGEKGDTGAALSVIDKLTDESQLPPKGEPGDAYSVNGFLFVWSEALQDWEDLGNIKGEKGDKGDKGAEGESAYQVALANGFVGTSEEWLASLKGEKGDAPDLTEINEKVDGVKNEVTEHLAHIASKDKLGHVKVGKNLTIDKDGTLNAINEEKIEYKNAISPNESLFSFTKAITISSISQFVDASSVYPKWISWINEIIGVDISSVNLTVVTYKDVGIQEITIRQNTSSPEAKYPGIFAKIQKTIGSDSTNVSPLITFPFYVNSGSPEGVIYATAFSQCFDKTGKKLYIKSSPLTNSPSNTGWVLV